MLRQGMEHAPTDHQRTICRNALSVLFLRKTRYAEAEHCLSIPSAQIIQFPLQAVLKAHALAAQNQGAAASVLLAEVKRSGQAKIIHLAEFLERRYGLGSARAADASPELEQRINDHEFALVLRAA